MYTNANQTNATFCEPGYYCKNGIKHNCTGNYFGESHNLTSDICDGACGSFLEPNDNHTKCIPSAKKLLPFILGIIFAVGATIYFIQKRFKKVKVRVQELKQEKEQVNRALKREKKKVVELKKLNQPSSEQEAIFREYRTLLTKGNSEEMPHKVTMYTMDNIKLEKSLGKGGYGEVFKGYAISEQFGETIQKDVALKQLLIKSTSGTAAVIESFFSEVRALASVGIHLNVVAFYGVAWDIDTFPSIVLEYVAGGELAVYLKEYTYKDGEHRGLGNATLQTIAIGIVKGVQHIHSTGMVHRDLKPQNILLDRADAAKPPIPKVADFGESRLEDIDVTMTYVGTKYYISPEIFRGERYGTSSDIFSLGIILNQMDTLQHPSTGNHYDAMQRKLPGSFRPRPRDDVPEKILAILKACTRFDNNPEYGPDGDLSYGRPSIDALLNMLEMLGKGEDLRQPSSANLNSYARASSRERKRRHLYPKSLSRPRAISLTSAFGLFRLKC